MISRRIHILGGSCAGKSTVARTLSDRLGIKAHALDDPHWDNSHGYLGIRRDPDEKQRMLAEILETDSWILEGVYYPWLADAFSQAELIVILTPGIWTRQARMVRRFVRGRLGKENGQKEGFKSLWETLRWNQRYDRNYLPAARKFIDSLGKSWTECRTYSEVLEAVGISET
jgi:adenylate kinase family enzyme